MANPDVFISYSSKDRARVAPIAQNLLDQHLNVWWDRDLKIGNNFRGVIQSMLDATRVVLVFWSRTSIKSQFVIDEAEEGLRRGILVPVRLDKVDAPLGLRGWQYADLFNNNGQNDKVFNDLIEAVKNLLNHGVRPHQKWLPSISDGISWSMTGASTLEKLSLDVQVVANLLSTDIKAIASLKTAINEVYQTYAAVAAAVDQFTKLQSRKGIRRRPLKAIAKGRLSVEVNKRRGHCTAIGLAYFGHAGIRDALIGITSSAKLKSFDNAFSQLSTADGDAFQAMTEITLAMAGEATAIINHLAAGQEAVARARLSEDVSQLRGLEAKLNEQMTTLLSFAGKLGIIIEDED